ncbi:hypothetical protein K474DRAFT_1713283 [Panus rudis PR-1116 ss-1]|nr:hypothetical protein K474DRAFT_1713283 [Panus rudis PR-1116 ss-1]
MAALTDWHPGTKSLQRKLGWDGPMSQDFLVISGDMPYEHRVFHSTRLPFLPMTVLDEHKRPWTSIFAAKDGRPGFIKSPYHQELDVDIHVWEGDPFLDAAKLFGKRKFLTAGIGIEFSTRRRNKLAGFVRKLQQKSHNDFHLELEVNEAVGNCPKYINLRDLVSHPDTHPVVEIRKLQLDSVERLPQYLIDFIHAADTVFIGTYYEARKEDEDWHPSHAGQNQRGGRPGFIRVRPSDGRTVVLPDFSGNRHMTSLGNIEITPVASLTFVDSKTGDILYLTGNARTFVGAEAQALMPRQNCLTTTYVTGYTFVRDALPVRQRPGSEVERSPYSPPVKLLAEEMKSDPTKQFDTGLPISLASIEMHSDTIATFTWETTRPVVIKPGQTAILNFTDLLGTQKYFHMAPWKPESINDDRIRTWTVSSAHPSTEGTNRFALTMREKPGGAVTGALFVIAHKLAQIRPELLADASPLELKVKLQGIAGDFVLDAPDTKDVTPQPLLWIAGGIGITPFLSFLKSLRPEGWDATPSRDIHFILSTREPEVLVPLIYSALASIPVSRLSLRLEVFSREAIPPPPNALDSITFTARHGRLESSAFGDIPDVRNRAVYLCGPPEFEKVVLDGLESVGVDKSAVRREGFAY